VIRATCAIPTLPLRTVSRFGLHFRLDCQRSSCSWS
jgi:hypothetical protein